MKIVKKIKYRPHKDHRKKINMVLMRIVEKKQIWR